MSDPAGPSPSEALDQLVRWQAAGGEWRLLTKGPPAVVDLVTCDGGQEMVRLESSDPAFLAYVEACRAISGRS